MGNMALYNLQYLKLSHIQTRHEGPRQTRCASAGGRTMARCMPPTRRHAMPEHLGFRYQPKVSPNP